MEIICLDYAIIFDSFRIFKNYNCAFIWAYLTHASQTSTLGLIPINNADISKKLKINKPATSKIISILKNLGLIIDAGNNLFSIGPDRDLCNLLRSKYKERVYTRHAVLQLPTHIIPKFLVYPSPARYFYLYCFLLFISEIDLWPDTKQIRIRFNLVTCFFMLIRNIQFLFKDFLDIIIQLRKDNLIKLDQDYKIHIMSLVN